MNGPCGRCRLEPPPFLATERFVSEEVKAPLAMSAKGLFGEQKQNWGG